MTDKTPYRDITRIGMLKAAAEMMRNTSSAKEGYLAHENHMLSVEQKNARDAQLKKQAQNCALGEVQAQLDFSISGLSNDAGVRKAESQLGFSIGASSRTPKP